MSIKLPELIAIDHDDYHAEFVGKTADGTHRFQRAIVKKSY
jgi:hypothetical protein